ncbi:MAG: efflux RND transporter periplasmic adaptor subunit [Clostridia bacterium]
MVKNPNKGEVIVPSKPKKKRKNAGLIALIIIVFLIAGFLVTGAIIRNNMNAPYYETHTVKKGSIIKSVTATGTLKVGNTESIETLSGITVESVEKSVGDIVKIGDTIAFFDKNDVNNLIDTLSLDLTAKDADLASMRKSEDKAVSSTVKGRVKLIYGEENSSVEAVMLEHGALMVLSTDGFLKLTFDSSEDYALYSKLAVENETGKSRRATIISHTGSTYTALVDDDAYSVGTTLAISDTNKKISEATTEINAPYTVLYSNGKIKSIHVGLNDSVSVGEKLYTVSDAVTPEFSYRLAERERAADALSKAVTLKNANYALKAEMNGTIASLSLKNGEMTVGSTKITTVGTSVMEGEKIEMTSDIDELDILSLKLGQKADVKISAIPGAKFEGEITALSSIGISVNEVTNYSVTITLKNADSRILIGMNAAATIVTERRDDVLIVPLELLNEESDGKAFVLLSATGDHRGKDMVKTYIESGLSDGINVEIVKGLKENDIAMYQLSESTMLGMMRFMKQNNVQPTPEGLK